ncbi:hypothetical protein BLOT_000011 [Blomia tropicalis]|nr:hypothetical protein BLOT_000011 [Blomia tropicalis]
MIYLSICAIGGNDNSKRDAQLSGREIEPALSVNSDRMNEPNQKGKKLKTNDRAVMGASVTHHKSNRVQSSQEMTWRVNEIGNSINKSDTLLFPFGHSSLAHSELTDKPQNVPYI